MALCSSFYRHKFGEASDLGSMLHLCRVPSYLPFSFLLFPFISSYSIIHKYPNICVFTMSAGGFLLGKLSESSEILGEMMEPLAPALEATAVEGLESLIPVLEVVMEIPAPESEANVPSPSPKMTTTISTAGDLSAPSAVLPLGLTQKEMESSISIAEVASFMEETEIPAPSQEEVVAPPIEHATHISEEGVGPIAEGSLHG